MYIHLLKALYGFMESTILWCDLYNNTLKFMDFKLNPYARYVVSKMEN